MRNWTAHFLWLIWWETNKTELLVEDHTLIYCWYTVEQPSWIFRTELSWLVGLSELEMLLKAVLRKRQHHSSKESSICPVCKLSTPYSTHWQCISLHMVILCYLYCIASLVSCHFQSEKKQICSIVYGAKNILRHNLKNYTIAIVMLYCSLYSIQPLKARIPFPVELKINKKVKEVKKQKVVWENKSLVANNRGSQKVDWQMTVENQNDQTCTISPCD